MDPYQVLGIPLNATEDQIKTAYRKLIKEYHPDRNKSATAAVIIQRVNEAYEVLTNPGRNQLREFSPDQPDQRPEQQRTYEEHKAAFLKKKREQEKWAYEQRLELNTKIFKLARMVAFPMLIVSLLFIVDEILPPNQYMEISERGWQRVDGGTPRHPSREGMRHNYMRTAHFKRLEVPNQVLLDYDFYINPELLQIEFSPIFHVPETVQVETRNNQYEFEALSTIYSMPIPFHHLLFIFSCITILRKKFSYGNLLLSYLPLLLFLSLCFYCWCNLLRRHKEY